MMMMMMMTDEKGKVRGPVTISKGSQKAQICLMNYQLKTPANLLLQFLSILSDQDLHRDL